MNYKNVKVTLVNEIKKENDLELSGLVLMYNNYGTECVLYSPYGNISMMLEMPAPMKATIGQIDIHGYAMTSKGVIDTVHILIQTEEVIEGLKEYEALSIDLTIGRGMKKPDTTKMTQIAGFIDTAHRYMTDITTKDFTPFSINGLNRVYNLGRNLKDVPLVYALLTEWRDYLISYPVEDYRILKRRLRFENAGSVLYRYSIPVLPPLKEYRSISRCIQQKIVTERYEVNPKQVPSTIIVKEEPYGLLHLTSYETRQGVPMGTILYNDDPYEVVCYSMYRPATIEEDENFTSYLIATLVDHFILPKFVADGCTREDRIYNFYQNFLNSLQIEKME